MGKIKQVGKSDYMFRLKSAIERRSRCEVRKGFLRVPSLQQRVKELRGKSWRHYRKVMPARETRGYEIRHIGGS